ncbi:ABC transporter permease [Fodinicurvata sp. EGI_FJ10296]|uniref:ABC transporter permease n=1 Tax=Fodinicurvata sp. EGI_FJ10296 TaxID=3231908 RepID=UPI0034556536
MTTVEHAENQVADGAAAPKLVTADGVPLKSSLKRAERRKKLAAFFLVTPLLLFIIVTFILPIASMLWRSVDNPALVTYLPNTVEAIETWDGDGLPDEAVYAAMVDDLIVGGENRTIGQVAVRLNYEMSGARSLFSGSARRADELEPPYKEALIDLNPNWGEISTWRIIEREASPITASYYLAAVDMGYGEDGSVQFQDENRRIYLPLFGRTLVLSISITLTTLALGFPIAYLLATLPMRYSNLLMIFVLLPFWTSLLVRTSAWIVLLQQQGVINEILVSLGLLSDDNRVQMVYNATGTVIAMTHILLPFMVLPLYSVMKTIPPSYMRAACSLGAHPFLAYWRVYVPQTVPGIAAGAILVFIISIGYYITPALVGGQSGQLISNLIAHHMQSSLNWGLAAALGSILLAGVLILYWLFNRLVGVEKLKFG